MNKNLQIINVQKETSKIKSGCFDELNSFVYSTSTHIKYMFLEGKTTGTFRSIDEPVYVSFFMRNQIFALTRQGEMEVFPVDNTDYLFKIALQNNKLHEVKEILQLLLVLKQGLTTKELTLLQLVKVLDRQIKV